MGVYLEEVVLKDIQSYVEETFKFSPGLNIIKAGDNSEGKSVFFKVLREAVTPGYWGQKGTKQLIRWGAEYGAMIFKFSDGSIWVFKLGKTKRVYVKLGEDGTAEKAWEEPPKEFLEKLGIINHERYIANMVTTSNDLLFVESGGTNDRALLALLTTHEVMEDVRDTVVEDSARKRQILRTTMNKLTGVKSRMETYALGDLEGAKKREKLLRHMPKALNICLLVKKITDEELVFREAKEKERKLALYTKGLEVVSALEGLREEQFVLEQVKKRLESLTEVANSILPLEELVPNRLEGKQEKIEFLETSMKLCKEVEGLVPVGEVNLESRIKSLELLATLSNLKEGSKEESQKITILEILAKNLGNLSKIAGELGEGKKLEIEAKKKLEEIEEYLEENVPKGLCPFFGKEVYYSESGCKLV